MRQNESKRNFQIKKIFVPLLNISLNGIIELNLLNINNLFF